ncbi:MAG: glycosyltransferase [Firmicutes bacterium]|nr:glycosyltransferase [Bacillota bacterium]
MEKSVFSDFNISGRKENLYPVSVTTPIHSTPMHLVRRAFQSLWRQSFGFSKIQWVIVLHNCTASYKSIIKKEFSKYENIKIAEADAPGTHVAYARNLTLREADGKYIMFLDSDDEMEKNAISEVIIGMEKTGAQAGCMAYEHVIGKLARMDFWVDASSIDGEPCVYDKGDPRIADGLCISGKALHGEIFRRDFLFKNHIYFKEDIAYVYGEDAFYSFKAFGMADKVAFFPHIKGYIYYFGLGMTCNLVNTSSDASKLAESVIDLFNHGRQCGLDLNNLLCFDIWLYRIMLSNNPKSLLLLKEFDKKISPLAAHLKPPIMQCKEKQPQADQVFASLCAAFK